MLKIDHIHKIFRYESNPGDFKIALQDVSLTIEDGEFITMIGSNGSGKSTLLNCIAGVYQIDQGMITIDGVNLTPLKEHERARFLGRVFQDPTTGTVAAMSIEENMAIASRRGSIPNLHWGLKAKNRKWFKECLAPLNLELEQHLHQKVGFLSGGQRQALTLLMATLKKPKLLLLDEHTAALDPKTAALVLDLTERLVKEQQLTTIMITHNMKDALKLGNRLIMMDHGRVILDVKGQEKQQLSVNDLIAKFHEYSDPILPDSLLLS